MNARPISPLRQSLIAEAQKLVGARFWWHGRAPEAVDCYGLLYVAGRAAGFEVPDIRGYSPTSIGDDARASASRWFEPLNAIGAAIPGDVIEFRVRRRPQHYGLLADDDYLIHANLAVRKVTATKLRPDDWKNAIAAHRFPGIDAHG